MWKLLRLYVHFLRFSFSRAMEFRFDFFFRIFMDVIYYIVNITFYKIIFLHTPTLGGWNEHQIMIFVAGYLLIDSINMTLFANNLWMLPSHVNRGDLDYYLVRPVSSLFFLSVREFAVNSFVNFLMTVAIFIWAISSYPGHLGAGKISLFILAIGIGTFLYYILHTLILLPVFWLHSARGLEGLFWPMTRFMERPDRIFKGKIRLVFTTLLPVCLVASFPARLVLEKFDWTIFAAMILATTVFFPLLLWTWQKALRVYSSASS